MRKELVKKLLAIALALVVGVTFVPLLGDSIYAEDESDGMPTDPAASGLEESIVEEPATDENDIIDEETVDGSDISTPEDIETDEAQTLPEFEEPESVEGENKVELSDEAGEAVVPEGATEDALVSTFGDVAEVTTMTTDADLYSFTASRSGSTLIVNAYFKDHPWYSENGFDKSTFRFNGIYIDGYLVGSSFSSAALSNYRVSLSNNLSPGYHDVTALITFYNPKINDTSSASSYKRTYRAGITRAPSAKGSLAIYHNYLDYMSPTDPNLINYKLFLEYSLNGKTWKTYGPMNYIQTYKLKGLKANRKYFVRSYYGVYLNGTWFTSKEEGKTRWIGTYRTGVAKRPAVKSIKVKAYKVKKKTQRVYGYYTGLYLGKRKYYKYKLKIIVTLKQKPGNKIWINGKKFKGNKKKYTVNLGTFTSYSKPKGKKYKVAMYTYRSASWGGYSPMYKKVLRIK